MHVLETREPEEEDPQRTEHRAEFAREQTRFGRGGPAARFGRCPVSATVCQYGSVPLSGLDG